MKITLAAPYLSLHGQVKGLNPADPDMRFYFRTNKQTGEVWACKCPNQTKPPSAAQLANRARFTQIYAKATGDRQQATGNRRQGTGDRRLATGDRRQGTGDTVVGVYKDTTKPKPI